MGPPCLEPQHFRHLHAELGLDAPSANTELGVVHEGLSNSRGSSAPVIYRTAPQCVAAVVIETVWLGAPGDYEAVRGRVDRSRGGNVCADAL